MGQHLDSGTRKALGAFYTDETVARYLVSWGLRGTSDAVLDPSCGDGRFLGIAEELGAGRLVGCDIDPVAMQFAEARVGRGSLEVHVGDFFALEPGTVEPVDLVVGNPPFIRYQNFSGKSRQLALESALRLGVRLFHERTRPQERSFIVDPRQLPSTLSQQRIRVPFVLSEPRP